MSSPLVSVCLPTYNYASFLPRAVESVLDQTFGDLELIVYDDASSDNTIEVMQKYLADDRVTFVHHEQNQGLFANFNQSIEHARGKYIKWLCADDWLDDQFLAKSVPLLEADDELVMTTAAHWLVDVDGQLIGDQRGPWGAGPNVPAAEVAAVLARWGNVVGMPTNTLIRRSALLDVGGFSGKYAPASDTHLWLKLLAHGDMGWVPEQLCSLRIHAAHSHDYGPNPTEAVFLIWEDAAELEGTPVTPKLAQAALNHEGLHCALYVAANLLRLRVAEARSLTSFMRKHVSLWKTAARFVVSLPRTALDQGRRLRALRQGKVVVYDPRPHAGPKLEVARAALAEDIAARQVVEARA